VPRFKASRRDAANDRRVAKQGNIVFWMTLAAAVAIVVVFFGIRAF
jgi:hypothetical protein